MQRLFGMPGGGANADLIEAAGCAGLPFSLAHTETGSAFMATAQAEITGKPGVCIATLGPGAASVMNGIANAYLDRVPLIVLTDCARQGAFHQAIPQSAMFSPLVKWTASLDTAGALLKAIDIALEPPQGPVHLDCGAGNPACSRLSGGPLAQPKKASVGPPNPRHPVALIGLNARRRAPEIRSICERSAIPALVTYKAKGVIPDHHPWFAGVLTNGSLERELLERADVFLNFGLDEVELVRPWDYPQPMIDGWQPEINRTDWDPADIHRIAEEQRSRMRVGATSRLAPYRVAELAAEVYSGARTTVDAGAHMFPVMALWPVNNPFQLLISNGLSTMGFALPAAIGAALLDPSQSVVVFTGDGGLMMCLGELKTAARESLRLRIIVFDDGELSLIKVKQVQRGYRTDGISIGEVNWPQLGAGLGVLARAAHDEDSLRRCLCETRDHPGPVLIAAKIDPDTYRETIRALRG